MDNSAHRYMTVEIKQLDRAFMLSCWFTVMDTWLLENEFYPNAYTEQTPDATWHIKANMELTVGILEMVTDYADEQIHTTSELNKLRLAVNRKRIT